MQMATVVPVESLQPPPPHVAVGRGKNIPMRSLAVILALCVLRHSSLFKVSNASNATFASMISREYKHRSLYYIHVGKTGGTSMSRVIRAYCEWYQNVVAKEDCFRDLVRIETAGVTGAEGNQERKELELSQVTKRHLHVRIRGGMEREFIRSNNITSFLWTLRNPTSRAVSAFDMDHIDNVGYINNSILRFWRRLFYKDCGFQTAQDLANMLMRKEEEETHIDEGKDQGRLNERMFVSVRNHGSNETTKFNCRQLAEEAVTGKAHTLINSHLSANYAKYAAITIKPFPEKEILVLRTEELWSDVRKLNRFLLLPNDGGGNNEDDDNDRNDMIARQRNISLDHRLTWTYGSEDFKVKSKLNAVGKAILCCFLSNENQIYEDLMRRAVNLNSEEKNKYLNTLYTDCGVEERLTPVNDTIRDGNKKNFDWKEWRNAGCPAE